MAIWPLISTPSLLEWLTCYTASNCMCSAGTRRATTPSSASTPSWPSPRSMSWYKAAPTHSIINWKRSDCKQLQSPPASASACRPCACSHSHLTNQVARRFERRLHSTSLFGRYAFNALYSVHLVLLRNNNNEMLQTNPKGAGLRINQLVAT